MIGDEITKPIRAAGIEPAAVAAWIAAEPNRTGDYDCDRERCSQFWSRSHELIRALPPKPARNGAEAAAADTIFAAARAQREHFLRGHVESIYDRLTNDRTKFMRIDELVAAAAMAVPGLTPTAEQIAAESQRLQRDKDGVEIDQGIFLAHVLASERAGRHLCHAMLLRRPETTELLAKLEADGALDLGAATIERRGKATFVTTKNPRFLNAEDQTTLDATEMAVDVAILDPATEIAVLRGGLLDHPKYRGRRVFGSGINLTRIYGGRIPYLWFLQRDLGFVHKFLRGVARPEALRTTCTGMASRSPGSPWSTASRSAAIARFCWPWTTCWPPATRS